MRSSCKVALAMIAVVAGSAGHAAAQPLKVGILATLEGTYTVRIRTGRSGASPCQAGYPPVAEADYFAEACAGSRQRAESVLRLCKNGVVQNRRHLNGRVSVIWRTAVCSFPQLGDIRRRR